MNKIKIIVCMFAYGGALLIGQGISGSVHDFSPQGWSGGEICIVCHTPHNASGTVTPLWNHELSLAAPYTLYTSPTFQGPIHQPGLPSNLCLSCHDGTVAIDSFGGTSGSNFIPANALIGIDLGDDHPIGVEWWHQTINGNCVRCHAVIPLNPLKMPLPFYRNGGRAKVECASCHDPHNNVTNPHLLRMPQTGSALCLQCHDK